MLTPQVSPTVLVTYNWNGRPMRMKISSLMPKLVYKTASTITTPWTPFQTKTTRTSMLSRTRVKNKLIGSKLKRISSPTKTISKPSNNSQSIIKVRRINQAISSGKNIRIIRSPFSWPSPMSMIWCWKMFTKTNDRCCTGRGTREIGLDLCCFSHTLFCSIYRCLILWLRARNNSILWLWCALRCGSICTHSWLCGGPMRWRWPSI